MKYSKKCESCDHTETAYTFTLNVGKVVALRKLVDYYETNHRGVNLEKLGLTNSQYTNFCHLVYFGLAGNTPKGWLPTDLGIAFIHGEAKITQPVATMGKAVLPNNHEAWRTHPGDRKEVFVFDIDQPSYKKRPEYAVERSGSLF